MSQSTNIEWTDATWPVVRGCSKISDGCKFCWAIRDAHLHAGSKNPKNRAHFEGLTVIENGRPNWTGAVRLDESILTWPLHWKKPRRCFAASSGDLFHENLPDEAIDRVFAVMALTPHITYQVLTKRARRMREYFAGDPWSRIGFAGSKLKGLCAVTEPLGNVWLGVSVENQPTADERIPELLRTPAALRFVSYEPALAEVDFTQILYRPDATKRLICRDRKGWTALDWCIIGGESGPGARPFQLEWARSTVRQFEAAGTPLFCKQLGANPREGCFKYACEEDPKKGGNPADWPRDLRIRQFPKPLAGPAGGRR